jgi:hypothetical protein
MEQCHILWEQRHANCFLAIGFVSLVVKQSPTPGSIIRRVLVVSKAATRKVTALAIHCFATAVDLADSAHGFSSPTRVFSPASTPAQSIYGLSRFVLALTAAVFVVVFGLLAYAVMSLSRHSSRLLSPRIVRKSLKLIRRPANSIDRGCHLRSTQYRRDLEEVWREASSRYVW